MGLGAQPSVHDFLPGLKIPVLCIIGEYDRKFTTFASNMCSKLPNGRLAIIRCAGDAKHLEKPGGFNRVVLSFLDKSVE